MEVKMEKYIVYKRTNKINGKVYIGQTQRTLEERWANGNGYHGSIKFFSAIKKYGPDNFEHEILKSNLTKEEADYWEEYYIKEFDSIEEGYNLKTGGSHCEYSEESRQKMSTNHADVSGEKNPMYGKHHSEESKLKMSQNRHDKTGADSPFAKRIRCIETDEIFGCVKDAAKWCGLASHSSISRYLGGRSKSAGTHPETKEKLHWEYVEI